VKGTLRVDGRAEGRLEAECVVLSESGRVKGEVKGRKLIIGGTVEGNLFAQELVEIKSKEGFSATSARRSWPSAKGLNTTEESK